MKSGTVSYFSVYFVLGTIQYGLAFVSSLWCFSRASDSDCGDTCEIIDDNSRRKIRNQYNNNKGVIIKIIKKL